MNNSTTLNSIVFSAILLFNTLVSQSAFDAIHFSENEFGFGTKALGMGGAFLPVANDYSAIYWNPAGLGQLSNQFIYSEFEHANQTNNALYNTTLSSDSRNYSHFGSLGFVRPAQTTRGALVFAFGYNQIQNFDNHLVFSGEGSSSNGVGFDISINDSVSIFYPFDEHSLRSEKMTTRGGLHEWTAGGAVMLSPNFTLGVSASLRRGGEDYRLRYEQVDQYNYYDEYPADYESYTITNLLQSQVTSLVFKVGGMFVVGSNLTFGGTITLPSTQHIDEVHSTEDLLIFDDGYEDATESTGQFVYRVRTPFVFDGGIAFRSSWLTLSGSARHRDWSQIHFVVDRNDYNSSDYRAFLDENELIQTNYHPTTEYRVGGELSLLKPLSLRAGYVLIPSSFTSLFMRLFWFLLFTRLF